MESRLCHVSQGGLVLDSEKPLQADKGVPALSWQERVRQPYHAVAGQLKEIFSGELLTTTLLLQFIWFTNALAYYGLVLLTTSVSAPDIWLPMQPPCPNIETAWKAGQLSPPEQSV